MGENFHVVNEKSGFFSSEISSSWTLLVMIV